MLRKVFRNLHNCVRDVVVVCLSVAIASSLMAQTGTGVLTGRVTDTSGSVVANATVTATSVDTGGTRTATTGTDGSYKFEGVPRGNYREKFEAASFKPIEIPAATISGSEPEVLNEKLEVAANSNSKPTPATQDNLPNAPSSSTTTPSLSDLGLSPEQIQGNAREQALLDKRTHMLKIHQRMGLITTIPLIVTVATSLNAGGKSTSSASRDLHT